MPYAYVALPLAIPKILSYKIPTELEILKPGQSVNVEIGKRTMQGFVLDIKNEPPGDFDPSKLKNVLSINQEMFTLSQAFINFMKWIAEYYACPIGDVLRIALPPIMKRPRQIEAPKFEIVQDTLFELTDEQHVAVEKISQNLGSFKPYLLHGVTGSGKTEVYLQLVAKVLKANQTSIVLVPEIALTPLLTNRFEKRFPGLVSIIHSGLSKSERLNEWKKIEIGQSKIVVGARSALFAPTENVGIIIIDEEHDSSYKQEDKPRYNARDSAIMRAKFENCPIVLGSATPSIESYYNALNNKYELIELTKRPQSRVMPDIEIVDLKSEYSEGFVSDKLLEALQKTFDKNEQAIILINRRGYSHYIMCKDCGEIPTCKNCSVSMSFTKNSNSLKCHYCGTTSAAPNFCDKCTSTNLKTVGFGTERIEEFFQEKFPTIKIARLDSDVVQKKGVLHKTLKQFSDGEINLIIGTQLVAKGHDFPNVTMIGILIAESGLHFPDFRAAERTFQLLMQVAGRAGRGDKKGKVLLQTFVPEHYSIKNTITHDYKKFYEDEIGFRENFSYSPFARILNIRVSGTDEEKVKKAIGDLSNSIDTLRKSNAQMTFIKLGPSPAPIKKLKNDFRWHLLIKAGDYNQIRSIIKIAYPLTNGPHNGCKVILDMDPQRMM